MNRASRICKLTTGEDRSRAGKHGALKSPKGQHRDGYSVSHRTYRGPLKSWWACRACISIGSLQRQGRRAVSCAVEMRPGKNHISGRGKALARQSSLSQQKIFTFSKRRKKGSGKVSRHYRWTSGMGLHTAFGGVVPSAFILAPMPTGSTQASVSKIFATGKTEKFKHWPLINHNNIFLHW